MAKTETHGDHVNCKCPHCGKNNNYVTTGIVVKCGVINTFSRPCHYCGEKVYYHATHEIMVTAYPEDLFATLRKPVDVDQETRPSIS